MRKPKDCLLVLLVAVVFAATAAPLKAKRASEKELPHSREYYDGYIKALVDHYQEIFRSEREITDNDTAVTPSDAKTSDTPVVPAKDEISEKTNVLSDAVDAGTQPNTDNTTSDNKPYANPEQPTKSRPSTQSDTELSESATPDAHKKNEGSDESSAAAKREKLTKVQLWPSTDETKLPETMQDIKYYTATPSDLEDMKKRSSEDSVDGEMKPQDQIKGNLLRAVRGAGTLASKKKSPDFESESKVISHTASTYTPGNPFKKPPSPNQNQVPNKLGQSFNKQSAKDVPDIDSETDDDQLVNQASPAMINNRFLPILLVPVPIDSARLGSASERRDDVGQRRKEGGKDDDDDEEEEEEEPEHSYLAPLHGYPGWYEAGHGIPYGYGTNELSGVGHHGYGGNGFGGYPEFGHHEGGHHGHGQGGYGYGRDFVPANGAILPHGFFNTPCGCNGNNAGFPFVRQGIPGFFS